jgi:hypothetical protein
VISDKNLLILDKHLSQLEFLRLLSLVELMDGNDGRAVRDREDISQGVVRDTLALPCHLPGLRPPRFLCAQDPSEISVQPLQVAGSG